MVKNVVVQITSCGIKYPFFSDLFIRFEPWCASMSFFCSQPDSGSVATKEFWRKTQEIPADGIWVLRLFQRNLYAYD